MLLIIIRYALSSLANRITRHRYCFTSQVFHKVNRHITSKVVYSRRITLGNTRFTEMKSVCAIVDAINLTIHTHIYTQHKLRPFNSTENGTYIACTLPHKHTLTTHPSTLSPPTHPHSHHPPIHPHNIQTVGFLYRSFQSALSLSLFEMPSGILFHVEKPYNNTNSIIFNIFQKAQVRQNTLQHTQTHINTNKLTHTC